MNITILLGTGRKARKSHIVANYVTEQVNALGHTATLVDVADYVFTETEKPDVAPKEWSHVVEESDAIIIVVPEYNHGYPGDLKLLLDSAYDEYVGKPVGLCGVSSGGLGGARVVENLLPVLVAFDMKLNRKHVYFSKIGELFDDSGAVTDESYNKRVADLVSALEA